MYWLILFLALVMRVGEDSHITLSNFIINVIAFLIFLKLAIIFHEIGHLLSAKLVGLTPRRLVLGKGYEILRFNFSNIKIILNEHLSGGMSFSTPSSLKYIKLKYFIKISSGLLTNLILAYLFYYFFGFKPHFLLRKYGIGLANAFIIANLSVALISLIPFQITYLGIKTASDGLNILKLPFMKADQVKNILSANDLLDAYEYIEDKEYDKAFEIYNSYLKRDKSQYIVNINLSVIHIKKGGLDTALKLLKDLEPNLETKSLKIYKAIIFNNIGWIYLLMDNIDLADKYSAKAFRLNKKTESIRGTRGCVLVEKGDMKQGIKILTDLANLKFVNNSTLTASIYLAYAYHLINKEKKKTKYYEFVKTNINKFDLDTKILFDSVTEKMKNPIKTK